MISRIILQQIRGYYRDGSAMFFGLIFPLVMTVCLGNLLANLDNPDSMVGTMKIAYYSENPAATDSFAQILKDTDGIELSTEKSAESAEKKVRDEKADAGMIFAQDMSVKVYEGGDKTKNRTVDAIARGFARESAAYITAYKTTGAPPSISTARPDLIADKKYDGRTRSMIDFYAVTMIIMICFMGGGIGGASEMYFARREGLIRRLAISPKRGGAIFMETVIGSIPGNVAQTLAVMIPATLIFGAHYAATAADNLLLFAMFVLLGTTVSAVFSLIGLFLRFNPYLIVMAVLWTLLFISGSFNRGINIPGVSEFMPMSIANNAAFELTLFGRPDQALILMAALAVILAAACAVGSFALRRKEASL
jgi:ABC-2 type transport system permease protein